MSSFVWIYSIIIVVVFVILFLVVLLTTKSDKATKSHIDNAVTMFLFAFITFSLGVVAIYSSIASADTGGKNVDASNKSAHSLYTCGTVFAWIGVAVGVIGIVALIYFMIAYPGADSLATKVGAKAGTIKVCLWLLIGLTIAIGFLCAFGAGNQGNSTSKKGYRAGIIATTISFVLAVLIISLTLSKRFKERYDKKQRIKKAKEEKAILNVEKSNLIEMEEIKEQREKIEQMPPTKPYSKSI